MKASRYYAGLQRKLGQDTAWQIAVADVDNLRTHTSSMLRVLRVLVREYMVEGDADWRRISELIAEDARAVLGGFRESVRR